MTEKVERYRITVDVYAIRLDEQQEAWLERAVRSFFKALFPLGLAPGYPDMQLIEGGPFGD